MSTTWQSTRPIAGDAPARRTNRKRLIVAVLASLLLSVVAVPFSTASAQASGNCKQPTHVWVGGLDNNGVIASSAPGLTIHVPYGHGVYLTGVVQPGTNIVFEVTVQGATGGAVLWTANAGSNCVVNQENFSPLPFLFEPEVESWSATYTDSNSGQQMTTFLGTIDVS